MQTNRIEFELFDSFRMAWPFADSANKTSVGVKTVLGDDVAVKWFYIWISIC